MGGKCSPNSFGSTLLLNIQMRVNVATVTRASLTASAGARRRFRYIPHCNG